ncbi:hypothetical protein C1H46_014403 [Malus baccata]|uniref:Uncharacterized protein n=1 Tax=Malus baccata TaxID=106549 RepID=A0A540MMN0_MALBA|nr:hypothetical protein C1H46_014403 [Malus baccata]
MGKIRKLMHGVHSGWKRMRAWYHAYKIKKMQNSPTEVKRRETKIMEDIAPTFNHPLYAETEEDVMAAQILKEAETDEDVRVAQILKEAGLRKGKAVSYHPDKKKEQKTVKKVVEAETSLKAVEARTK